MASDNAIPLARRVDEIYGTELTEKLLAAVTANEWDFIITAPKDGSPLRLFAPYLIDEDFNPSGSVEGYWQDDDGWVGAVWNSCQDCWDRKKIKPTHWMKLPEPPPVGQWAKVAERHQGESN